MPTDANTVNISYMCEECKQNIRLLIDKDVHLNRRELKINGLASYIDVHSDSNGKRHAIRLFIDHDFNVRTNTILEVNDAKHDSIGIPLPQNQVKNITTRYDWDTWKYLELEIKSENIKFILEDTVPSSIPNQMVAEITTVSELGNIVCKINAIINSDTPQVYEYISHWMDTFCNALELSSTIHMELIPEILRFIDFHVHREILYTDKMVIAVLIDKASILVPNKKILEMLSKFGPGLTLIGLDPKIFAKIATTLLKYDKFRMSDIREILSDVLISGEPLEEEYIVLSLYYMITMDAFDYKLSYLNFE